MILARFFVSISFYSSSDGLSMDFDFFLDFLSVVSIAASVAAALFELERFLVVVDIFYFVNSDTDRLNYFDATLSL